MTSNVGDVKSGPLFFPTTPTVTNPVPTAAPRVPLADRIAAVTGLTRAELVRATAAELQQTLQELYGALKNRSAAELAEGESHGNGSLSISSYEAVWLIGKVTTAYGGKLVSLSNVNDRDTLRSVAGVAGLLRTAIQVQLAPAGAA